MIVGCYCLDLYCDNDHSYKDGRGIDGIHAHNEFPHSYTAEMGATCRRNARRNGWKLKHNGFALCPKCSGYLPHVGRKGLGDGTQRRERNDAAEGGNHGEGS